MLLVVYDQTYIAGRCGQVSISYCSEQHSILRRPAGRAMLPADYRRLLHLASPESETASLYFGAHLDASPNAKRSVRACVASGINMKHGGQ